MKIITLDETLSLNWKAILRHVRRAGAGDNAEDCVQELWIKVQAEPNAHVSSPLNYLYRMATNLAIDQRRSDIRGRIREASYSLETSGRCGDADDAPSVDRILIGRQDLLAAKQSLDALGPRTKHIFLRARLDGANQNRIGGEMGITLSCVEKHLQRAYHTVKRERGRREARGE